MNHSIVKLAYKLCSIPSISHDEVALLRYLTVWLDEHGFIVEKIPCGPDRYSVFAYRNHHQQFALVLCTHVDTVAPFIKPRLDDDRGVLWGRGSCDAKGIAASMIFAALAEYDAGYDDIALLFTVGEEDSSDGAKACLPKLTGRARFVVVGEPTELKAACAQKGSLVFDLTATGIEAHSSMPALGDSAVHKIVHDMGKIIGHQWPHDGVFGETTVNFGEIVGGSMRNVIAGSATAKAIMRTSIANATLVETIASRLSNGVSLSVLSSVDPFSFYVPPEFQQFVAAFGSDAPYLRPMGSVMLIGPGSLIYAHRPDEHVSYADLSDAVTAYRRVAHHVRSLVGEDCY